MGINVPYDADTRQNDTFAEDSFSQQVRTEAKQALRRLSTANLATNLGVSLFGTVHFLLTLLHQRNAVYADRRRLTKGENASYALVLAITSFNVCNAVSELNCRLGGTAVEAEPVQDKKPHELVLDAAAAAASLGINFAEVTTGRTLFKKRELSKFGRVYGLIATTPALWRLQSTLRARVSN
jgi:hypothetical protein